MPFKEIHIKVIPHTCQRYETYGDYWIDEKGILQIRVSEFDDLNISRDISIHEFLEAWRCKMKGIDFKEIDKFDLEHLDHPDPGLLSDAPYHAEHMLSMDMEYFLAKQDGRNFSDSYAATPKGADK